MRKEPKNVDGNLEFSVKIIPYFTSMKTPAKILNSAGGIY